MARSLKEELGAKEVRARKRDFAAFDDVLGIPQRFPTKPPPPFFLAPITRQIQELAAGLKAGGALAAGSAQKLCELLHAFLSIQSRKTSSPCRGAREN